MHGINAAPSRRAAYTGRTGPTGPPAVWGYRPRLWENIKMFFPGINKAHLDRHGAVSPPPARGRRSRSGGRVGRGRDAAPPPGPVHHPLSPEFSTPLLQFISPAYRPLRAIVVETLPLLLDGEMSCSVAPSLIAYSGSMRTTRRLGEVASRSLVFFPSSGTGNLLSRLRSCRTPP